MSREILTLPFAMPRCMALALLNTYEDLFTKLGNAEMVFRVMETKEALGLPVYRK
jgi:hypothetical protein